MPLALARSFLSDHISPQPSPPPPRMRPWRLLDKNTALRSPRSRWTRPSSAAGGAYATCGHYSSAAARHLCGRRQRPHMPTSLRKDRCAFLLTNQKREHFLLIMSRKKSWQLHDHWNYFHLTDTGRALPSCCCAGPGTTTEMASTLHNFIQILLIIL